MLFPCSFFLGLASVLAHLRRTSMRVTVEDVLPEPFRNTPNATFTSENDNVRDGSFLSQQEPMPSDSEQAKNYALRHEGEGAAFYVGGDGYLAKVMKNTGDETGYHVERTWVLPSQYGDRIQWMTRFRTADVTADDDARKRVAVFTNQGRMLVIKPRDLQGLGNGEDLAFENVVDLGTSLTNPVGARASEDSGKLYVAMFDAGIVTVEGYRADEEGGGATVHPYSLSQQLDGSVPVEEVQHRHLHNVHAFRADMCGGNENAEVTFVNDLGEIWLDSFPETRGYGVLQFVEHGFSCQKDGGPQTCHFRSTTDLTQVPGGTGTHPVQMARQMHARQIARDLNPATERKLLFVAEQPVKKLNIPSRLHLVEVQNEQAQDAEEQNVSCNLIVKKTVDLPARTKSDKDSDSDSTYGDGAADVIPLQPVDEWSRVLISDRWADSLNGKVYLYEFRKNGNDYEARQTDLNQEGLQGPHQTWTVGQHPRHTALLYDGETLVSANMKSGDVSVNDITTTETSTAVEGITFAPWFVLE